MSVLSDPDLSLFLYILVIILGTILTPRWGKIMGALAGEQEAIATKASGVVPAPTRVQGK